MSMMYGDKTTLCATHSRPYVHVARIWTFLPHQVMCVSLSLFAFQTAEYHPTELPVKTVSLRRIAIIYSINHYLLIQSSNLQHNC